MKGNASAAIDCLRRALHYAPQKYKAEPLLNLGNILHRNGASEDAAIAVQWALDSSPDLSVLHFTMANILASLERDDEASEHYEASLQLQPRLVASAQLRLHAVRCRQALIAALNQQSKQWESALTMLRSKQARLMALQKTISKMREEQSTEEFSQIQETIYHKWLESERKRGTVSYCTFKPPEMYNPDLELSCPSPFLPSDHEIFWVDKLESKLGIGSYDDPVSSKTSEPPPRLRSKKSSKTGWKALYPNWRTVDKQMYFENYDWPGETHCKSARPPRWTDYDLTFVPASNKGFNVTHLFYGTFIEQDDDGNDQPICSDFRLDESFDHLSTSDWLYERFLIHDDVIDPQPISPTKPEEQLQFDLLSEFGCNRPCATSKKGPLMVLSKLGRNLRLAMKQSQQSKEMVVEPKEDGTLPLWLLHSIATTYWQALGQMDKAYDCSKMAISLVPLRYRDIPLTALASLYYRISAVEEAYEAITEALAAAPFDPETNYFTGSMLAVKGDFQAAIDYMGKAVRQKGEYETAEKFLKIIACFYRLQSTLWTSNELQRGCNDCEPLEDSHNGYPALNVLDGKMKLIESRTNSGHVVDLYMKTYENVKFRPNNGNGDDTKSDMVDSKTVKKQFSITYPASSVPYARLSLDFLGRLTAEPHLMTIPISSYEIEKNQYCLIFANGSLSLQCNTVKGFTPYLESIYILAKHFSETLQPKSTLTNTLRELDCSENDNKNCGEHVRTFLNFIPKKEFPRTPADISKFIHTVTQHLANNLTEPRKPTKDMPLTVALKVHNAETLENTIRLLLAVRRSADDRSETDILGSHFSASSCHSEEDSSEKKCRHKKERNPDPLSFVNDRHFKNLVKVLEKEAKTPGVVLASSSFIAENDGILSFAEPICKCDPPYKNPDLEQTLAQTEFGNYSAIFKLSSYHRLYYDGELYLQPWMANFQDSLNLDSSRSLAAVLAAHMKNRKTGPFFTNGWLSFVVAARYWRIRGNAEETARCLSAAIVASLASSKRQATMSIIHLELSDFLRHVGYLPHSLVAAASSLVFPNHSVAAAAASRLGIIFTQMERLDAAVIFYELAASAAAAYVAASTTTPVTTVDSSLVSFLYTSFTLEFEKIVSFRK